MDLIVKRLFTRNAPDTAQGSGEVLTFQQRKACNNGRFNEASLRHRVDDRYGLVQQHRYAHLLFLFYLEGTSRVNHGDSAEWRETDHLYS